jgi:prepilin-type N-terminal cleavage/methylation domain-containing protein
MRKNRGYTLIELMVSISIFAVVMTIAAGGYYIMISVNRHAQGVSTGVDNLSFALDAMTRGIRTGTAYSCGTSEGSGDCSTGGAAFTYTDQDKNTVTYQLQGSSVQSTETPPDGGTPVSYLLTEPDVVVTSLRFYVIGSQPESTGDARQPYVTMVISGTVNVGPGSSEPFTIQTSAAMRGTDL